MKIDQDSDDANDEASDQKHAECMVEHDAF